MTKALKNTLIIGALFVLTIQLVSQLALAKLDSQTTDEGVHLSAGYTYITRDDFRFNPEHPPLVKVLAAIPLLFVKPNITPEMETYWNRSQNFLYDSWQENRDFGEALLYKAGNNPDQILFWARLPNVIITFLLGLTIFLLVRKYWGELAAFAATTIYAFDPTITAHGHLVTTDIPLALTFLLATYCAWQFLQQPTWKKAVLLGITTGLALLTKHTAVILFPVFVGLWIVAAIQHPKETRRGIWAKLTISLVVIWALIWAGFGFHDRLVSATNSVTSDSIAAEQIADAAALRPYSSATTSNQTIDHAYSLIRPALLILPGDYLKGLFLLLHHVDSGQGAYLLGQTSTTGWWYYFPTLFIFKTPLPTLLLLAVAIWLLAKKRPIEWLPLSLAVAAGVFLLSAMSSKANLGVRHIMPVYPLIFIIIGWAFYSAKTNLKYVMTALIVWLVLIFATSFPTYLGYYNTLAGGSGNGYSIATDSNIDWGQDLHRIASYITANHIRNVYIEYGWDGTSALDYYLGKGSYSQLSSWKAGETGTAIIGASAYNNAQYQFLHTGHNCQQITSGTFACSLQ